MPKVLNKRFDEIPNGAVWVDRTTKYGNPFKMRTEADRDFVCDSFNKQILPLLDVSCLRGKDLVCWCSPKRCHADSILSKANS